MTAFVVDASIAIKWVTQEADSPLALKLYGLGPSLAPALLIAECANILWKKRRRGDLNDTALEAALFALEQADTELWAMHALFRPAVELSARLDHPAYDCFYLALAAERGAPFVTADASLIRKLRAARFDEAEVLSLAEAATLAA